MARPFRYEVRVRSEAPPGRVYSLLADAPGWKRWAPGIGFAAWERQGDPPPGGPGAIRKFGRWPYYAREQILVADEPHHHAYKILSGLPIRDYRADVLLEPDGSGTVITWRGSFDVKVPGTGPVLAVVFRGILTVLAKAVAKVAASAHADAGG